MKAKGVKQKGSVKNIANSKFKFFKVLGIVISIVIVLCLLISFLAGKNSDNELVDNNNNLVTDIDASSKNVEGVENQDEQLESDTEIKVTNEENEEQESGESEGPENSVYTNSYLGISFEYPQDWYYEDNTEKILNTIKGMGVDFDITKDPLPEIEFTVLKSKDQGNYEMRLSLVSKKYLNDLIALRFSELPYSSMYKNAVTLSSYVENMDGSGILITNFNCVYDYEKKHVMQGIIDLEQNLLVVRVLSDADDYSMSKFDSIKTIKDTLKVSKKEGQ